MPRKKAPTFPELPGDEVKHGWHRPPRPGRPPQQLIERCRRLSVLQMLDLQVEFVTAGRLPNGAERPLVRCPRCGARRNALYVKSGGSEIGCRGSLRLCYDSGRRLRRPACSWARVEELLRRAAAAKTRKSQQRWHEKATAAAEEYWHRKLARQQQCMARLKAFAAAATQWYAEAGGVSPDLPTYGKTAKGEKARPRHSRSGREPH
jgi:hypothetical protein